MITGNELSQDVIGEFRDRQKTRLQRTFVDGTDAANAKVKGAQPESKLESESEKKMEESNVKYFLSTIVSSSSKSITKEETMIKEEQNNFNQAPEASRMIVKYDSIVEFQIKKSKNKKKAFAVEKMSRDNDTFSKCTAPDHEEKIIQPTRKKKQLKNRINETHVENTSTDKSTAICPSEEINEPNRKKIKLKENINENLVKKTFIDNDAENFVRERDIAYIMAHYRASLQLSAQPIQCTNKKNVPIQMYQFNRCQSKKNFIQFISDKTCAEEQHIPDPPITNKLKVEIVEMGQPSNLVIIMLENDTNYETILRSSALYSGVQLQHKRNLLKFPMVWESLFFLDNRKCASIQDSQPLLNRRPANDIFQLLLGILEKTHYKIIITDKMCNSVREFMSQQEEDRLKKINYKTVVNDNKYLSMEYFFSQAEEYREEEEKRSEEKKKKIEEKKKKIEEKLKKFEEKRGNIFSSMKMMKKFEEKRGNIFSSMKMIKKFEEEGGDIFTSDPQPVKAMVAMKMMKMMGWTEGTGLGLQNQGIVEPVKAEKTDDRRGLGYGPPTTVRQEGQKNVEENRDFNLRSRPQTVKVEVGMQMMGCTEGTGLGLKNPGIVEPMKAEMTDDSWDVGDGTAGTPTTVKRKFPRGSFPKMIRRHLLDYVNSGSVHNIVFSNEFNIGQRKIIHKIAENMGLFTASAGEGHDRQITVSRVQCKRHPLIELLNQLLESKGSDPLFSRINLIPPTG